MQSVPAVRPNRENWRCVWDCRCDTVPCVNTRWLLSGCRKRRSCRIAGLVACCLAWCAALPADEFTILDDAGQRVTIAARWVAEGKQAVVLERRDGRFEVVPADRIQSRTPAEPPEPLTADEIVRRLQTELDESRFVSRVDPPFVIALVTTRPVDNQTKKRREQQLQRATKFLHGMQQGFRDYAAAADVELTAPGFPLVLLIFEDDREFNRYVTAQTSGAGLTAEKIASFYDLLSTRLVLRVRECKTFVPPLHEAIHQQAHNRGLLTRLAPVPAWFNEGLATGFEGDGERLKSGPKTLSRKYASISLQSRKVSWTDIVREDAAFQGDILAGEAYAHAWGLHWWLFTRYRPAYRQLLAHYSQLEPLTSTTAEERLQSFQDIIGKSPADLQREFQQEVSQRLREQ